jgi:hypothetical protein
MTDADIRNLYPEPDVTDVAAADAAVREVLRIQFRDPVPSLVLVRAVAGAGKSTLVVELARRLIVDRQECVAVAANTDGQSFLLVRRMLNAGVRVVLFVTETKVLPQDLDQNPLLIVCRAEADLRSLITDSARRAAVGLPDAFAIVANTKKWRSVPGWDGRGRPAMRPVAPVLIADEAYQQHDDTARSILSIGERWVAVGDPGQIDPPTKSDTTEWAHRDDGPHVPFPAAQLARTDPLSPGLVVLELPYTRRNPEDGLPFIQPFYEQPVRSLVPTGARRLTVQALADRNPADDVIDAIAAGQSVTSVVLPYSATGGQTDDELAIAIATTANRLLSRNPQVLLDPTVGFRDLLPEDIMVIATHHDQITQLLPLLPQEVVVGTADSLQGLDAPIVFSWHPLSGAPEPDSFHCDAGRTCVMLTRHTVATAMFMRDGIGEMLDEQRPSDLLVPTNPGDNVRRAWRAQRALVNLLERNQRVTRMP